MLKDSLSVEQVKETQYTGGRVCVTSCGKYLFCIHGSSVNVIEVNTGTTLLILESDEEEISCIALSPNDKHLITAHRNLLLKQWDNWNNFTIEESAESNNEISAVKTTSKCTRIWKAIHSAPVQFMCFDSTSTLLATGSSDHTTKIWDIEAQYCTHNLKGSQSIITWCQFHPLIQRFQKCITGSEDNKLRVYDLNSSKLEACLEGHFSAITHAEYINFTENDKDFNYLLSAARDKVIIIWDLKTFTKIRTMPVYESIESFLMVKSFLSSEKFDRFLVTMGNDGLLKLWDTKTSKCILKQHENDSPKIINRHKTETNQLEQCIIQSIYIKSTNTLVMVTIDQLIVFIQLDVDGVSESIKNGIGGDIEPFKVSKQFIGDHGEILDAQLFHSNENLLALATNSEFIKIYDLDTWSCKLLKGHKDLVICLCVYEGKLKGITDDEQIDYFASSSKDSTIKLWKVTKDSNGTKHECLTDGIGHTQDVGSLAFSRCSLDFIVSGSIDTTIKLWKIAESPAGASLTVQFTMKAHEKDINSICVSPNDKLIASGSSDRTAKIWNSIDGSCLAVLRGHKRGIWCVQFSTVDQLVATGSADGFIKLWSLSDFSCVKTFEGHNTSVLKLNFLNHGTQLISSGSDGLIKLWSIKTNECVGTFDQHNDKAWALCVSKDESRVLSGGADGKLVIWKDVTQEKREEEIEKNQEILLKEQELSNFLKEKKWKKALGLAIILDKPFKCYEIIKEILQQTDEVFNTDNKKTTKGKLDLESTLLKLRDDQIKTILKYAIGWNTNTKFCHLSQALFEVILRNYPPEFMIESANNFEFSSKLIEQFLPYTERHNARLNKLAQQIMFIDFAWSNMKLNNLETDMN